MSADDRFYRQQPKKSFWELGPAWITAIATIIVALTGAGFWAGVKVSSHSPAQTTVTTTVTSPSTVQPTVTVTVAPSPTPTSPRAVSVSAGKLIGSYTFTLPANASAPLGSQAPTAQQILAAGGGTEGDVYWATGYAGAYLETTGGDHIVALPDGATPTYQQCRDSAELAPQEPHDPGTAFCIIETTGEMAGVYVDSVNQSPSTIVLTVRIWNNLPS